MGSIPLMPATGSHPFVSIIIPCRNERDHIVACLDSVLATDYPLDRLEILVVDGASDDGTHDILAAYSERHPRVRCLENPQRITPVALNIGIRRARGDVIMRMDAHSRYPRNYIGGLVDWLERSGADNVGGAWRTLPTNGGTKARAIATALAHPFAVGGAHYRLGVTEPRWVDTVPFGCYRRSVFDRIGLFDEELVRNQDDEFNHRLLKHGGRILLVPDVTCDYYARESMRKLARMYYQYGYFKPLVARKLGRVFTLRQFAPPLFVATLVFTCAFAPWSWWIAASFAAFVAIYLTALIGCTARVATFNDPGVMLWVMLTFPVVHLSYGGGFLHGVLDFLLRGRGQVRDATAVPVSR